ncbi:hypothetical protein CHS0354_025911 [Potamilus streckersoni]|uniref:Uncharacterized protein n=1 Tax=Potamilus streckersoni TaxID=2493646 RepID=A0AAE0T3Y0_9BIVA|nr:hypothetical protein CHS0354_025911 [Potamilus streckersoni]
MAGYDLFEHLRIHFFALIWLLMSANGFLSLSMLFDKYRKVANLDSVRYVYATVCSDKYSGSSPVLSMCFGGIATGRVVVLDAQTATKNDTECSCFLTANGSISLTVNAAQQPGYAGCGSKIDVSFSSPHDLFIFNCFASSSNHMDNGSTANFTLLKSTSASLWNYCLVLQVFSSDQSDSIKMECSGPAIGLATSLTLETTVATALTSKVTTIGTMSTSSPVLLTTKTNEQLRTDSISFTVRENFTTEGITETNISNSTTHKLSTTVPTTRTFTIPSITSSANMTNPTSPHIDLFPSTEKEAPPPSDLPTTLGYISITTKDTLVTTNVTTSTTILSLKQTQTSAGKTASTLTMPSATSSSNMTNPTSPHIDSLPSTEKETSPTPELSTTLNNISTTTKDAILTEKVTTTTTTDILPNQTQTKIHLTSPVSFTPNVAALETTTITTIISNTPHVRSSSLKTEPTTDILLSRSTISPVSDSSSVTTSLIATPTRMSKSSPSNSTSSTMEMTHTSVTTNTITQTNITSLKSTVRTTERTLPSTIFSTILTSTTVISAQTSRATEPTASITKTVTQNPSPSSPSSSSSSPPPPPPSSSSSSITSTFTSFSSSSLLLSSSKASASPGTTNTTSTFTTTQSTQLSKTTLHASSSLPPSISSTSSSSQSTTRRENTTTSESTAKVSEGITGRNVTTSPLEKKEIELLPVVLPASLAGAIIIAFVLFLTITMVIRHRRTKSYHTGQNGEYYNPIYSGKIKDEVVESSVIGYDNLIYTKNKELQSPSNGTELTPIQNVYGEEPVNIADHLATSFGSDNYF